MTEDGPWTGLRLKGKELLGSFGIHKDPQTLALGVAFRRDVAQVLLARSNQMTVRV